MYFKKGQRFIHIKKPVCIVSIIATVLVVALVTVMLVNPFGPFAFKELLKLKQGVAMLEQYYYEDVKTQNLADGALAGIAASTQDPYTEYMPKDVADSFVESIESDDYAGVGMYIQKDTETNYVLVTKPINDSPAQQAGIVAGDKITKVDGQPVETLTVDEVAAKMKGKEGTTVKLTILKADSGEAVEITLTRAIVKLETVTWRMLDGKNIGYIYIEQFGVNTYDEFVNAYNMLAEGGAEQLVLDLRNNPGGVMDAAVNIADVFIGEELIVYTMDKEGRRHDYMGTEAKSKAPMAILINGYSASASEVLVGALTHYNLATTVGEKTFGKGVTQTTHPFVDGSMLKITDSRYYTPGGECIHGIGIKPDVEVKLETEAYAQIPELDILQDAQLQKAIEILEN